MYRVQTEIILSFSMALVKNGILPFGMVLWLLCGIAQAQVPSGQPSASAIQEEVAKYENYYEHILNRALKEYYSGNTFLVDVKAHVEEVVVARGYEMVKPPRTPQLENLPGLPFLPPELQNEEQVQDSLKPTGFDSHLELSRLSIKVLVDTSYSVDDLEFIGEAALMVSNADLMRGDVVEVDQRAFPRDPRAPQTILPLNHRDSAMVMTTAGQDTVRVAAGEELLGIDWDDPRQLLYLIAVLGLIILALLLFMAFRRPKEKEPEHEIEPEIQYYPQLPAENGTGGESRLLLEGEVGEIHPETRARFESDKMFITHACVSNPGLVSDVISGWIEQDREEGIVRAVRSIHSVDPRLIDILNPHLTEEQATSIRFGLSGMDELPIDEKAEEAAEFKTNIRDAQNTLNGSPSETDLFEFLDQMTNQQLLHLVKDESDEMTAILLAQVAGERSGYVLQRMPEQRKLSVLVKMGKINNIPVSIYKKVASHFSSKALAVSDMKYVAADGVDSILHTIDNLPVDEQEDFVNSIAEQDLELAKKIRRYFISFEDLPKLRDELLQASIESLDTESIIPALHNASNAVKQKVLSVRPKRERQLILSELTNMHDLSAAEVEQARKALLRKIRQYLKSTN